MSSKRDNSEDGLEHPSKQMKTNSESTKATWSCEKCGLSGLPSRNKLFKHYKFCPVELKLPLVSEISDSTFFDRHEAFIYVTGGRVRGKTLGCVERYNIKQNEWETCPSMLENRGSHCSAVVNNVIYVIGGGGFHSNLTSNEKFDTASSKWIAVASMPTSRHALVGLTVGSNVYAIGGWIDGSICSTDIERYDTVNDVWTKLTPMTIGRRLLGATEVNNKIYVFGGNCDDGIWNTNALEIYDIASDSWTLGAPTPVAGQCSAIAVGDLIYVFLHGAYVVRYDPLTNKYTQLTESLPVQRWFSFDVTACNGVIYLHGGNENGVWSDVLYSYSVSSNTFTKLASMKKERRRCSASVIVL